MQLKDMIRKDDPDTFAEIQDSLVEWENKKLQSRIEKFVTRGDKECSCCNVKFEKDEKRVKKKGVFRAHVSSLTYRFSDVAFDFTLCEECDKKYFKHESREEVVLPGEAHRCGYCNKFVFHNKFIRGIVIKYKARAESGWAKGKLVNRRKSIIIYFCDERCMEDWEDENKPNQSRVKQKIMTQNSEIYTRE